MTDEVQIREVPFNDEHLDQKWIVLEGYVDGVPACTKRRTVNVYALVSGALTLEAEEQKLRATVTEYKERWDELQKIREKRGKPDKPDKPDRGPPGE